MKKILFITSIFVLFGISCTDLNEELYSNIPAEEYPESDDQVANLSVEAYNDLSRLIDDDWFWFLTQEISGDGVVFPTRGGDWDDGGKWRVLYEHSWNDDVEAINDMWNIFKAISLNNSTIERLKALPESDAVTSKIKEVETVRSFYYYLLMDNYGDVPYVTIAEGAPEQPEKITRAAVFDSLIVCVEEALPYLKPLNTSLMATRYMGFALLAKLYLNAEVYTGTAQWAKAEQFIDSVLAGPFTLNPVGDVLSSFITANEGNLEGIFTIPFDKEKVKGFRIHMRSLHYQSNLTFDMVAGPWNGGCLTKEQWDAYEETDLRKQKWFLIGQQYDSKGEKIIDNATNTPLVFTADIPALVMNADNATSAQIRMSGARFVKYEVEKGADENLSNDFPLFRLSDFYLMKAEVMVRQGNNGDDYINPIRVRAGLDELTDATLDSILAERGRELILEGHRRQDLIRFGKFLEARWERPVSSSDRITFPIPKWAKDANPNLE